VFPKNVTVNPSGNAKQLYELGEVIECYCKYLRRVVDPNPNREAPYLAHHLIRFLCRFKEKNEWGKESEWRLVYAPEIDPPLEVKIRYNGKRFVEFDLLFEPLSHGAEPDRLPIREIMYGPDCEPQSTNKTVQELLRRFEYLSVNSSGSGLSE
jgi:hypothetical protein